MRIESRQFVLRENCVSQIPRIGRDFTKRFVEQLHCKGAVSSHVVEFQQTRGGDSLIIEMFVVAENKSRRDVLDEMLKTVPDELVETTHNVFRIRWESTNGSRPDRSVGWVDLALTPASRVAMIGERSVQPPHK